MLFRVSYPKIFTHNNEANILIPVLIVLKRVCSETIIIFLGPFRDAHMPAEDSSTHGSTSVP